MEDKWWSAAEDDTLMALLPTHTNAKGQISWKNLAAEFNERMDKPRKSEEFRHRYFRLKQEGKLSAGAKRLNTCTFCGMIKKGHVCRQENIAKFQAKKKAKKVVKKIKENKVKLKEEEEEESMFMGFKSMFMGFDTVKLEEIESALMIDSELKVKVKEEVEDVKPTIQDSGSFVKDEFPKLDLETLKTRAAKAQLEELLAAFPELKQPIKDEDVASEVSSLDLGELDLEDLISDF